jgi:Flp pilus assembly protein TadG
MAAGLAAFLGFAAMGFDLAYVRYARLQLQNATDAASHAALVRLRATGNVTQARAMAVSVAAMNKVWGKTLVIQDSDITFGGWDFSTKTFTLGVTPSNAVQVTGARSALVGTNGAVATTFGRVLGKTGINLTHNGTAAYRIRSIVVAQDITGSFGDSIDEARNADVTLLDQLKSYNVAADRIGMQLFTGDGTQWTALTTIKSGYNGVRNQWYGDGKASTDPTKTSGITVCNKLDLDPGATPPMNHAWVPHCSSGGDGTNQGAAIKRATDQLLAQSQPYETRVIVLITDGEPTCCTTSGMSVSCSSTNACAQSKAQYGVDMANAAASQGISIFTVSLGASPSQSVYNASLARGIGAAYDTPDDTQLVAILAQIAGAIPIVLVK